MTDCHLSQIWGPEGVNKDTVGKHITYLYLIATHFCVNLYMYCTIVCIKIFMYLYATDINTHILLYSYSFVLKLLSQYCSSALDTSG